MKIHLLLFIFIASLVTGCASLKQEIWLYGDGSAKLHAELTVQKDKMLDPTLDNPFTRNIDQSDPNLTAFDAGEFEENGRLHYFAEATVKDFETFAAQNAFAFTKFAHETYASGNFALRQIFESINQDFPAILFPQNLAPFESMLEGSTVTLVVHAPSIFYTDGKIITQDANSATAQLQIPMSEAIAGLGVASFAVDYGLAPAPPLAAKPESTATTVIPKPDTTAPTATATPAPVVVVTSTTEAVQADIDSDGDWVLDSHELTLGADPTKVDSDGDSLSDFEEIFIFHTDPANVELDTDGDGFADIVEEELFQSDPMRADKDEDGDLIPDSSEVILGTDPARVDSDGDLLSDLIELYLLASNPKAADPDTDQDGFPDIWEEWRPAHLAEVTCAVDIAFRVDSLVINDPEEADTTSITGGDEAFLVYAMSASQDGKFYGSTQENRSGDPKYRGDGQEWQGEGFTDSRFTNFRPLGPLPARCGYFVVYGVQVIEDDAPWGGYTDMGVFGRGYQLLLQRLPLGWSDARQGSHHFKGTAPDGSYDYALQYTFTSHIPELTASHDASQAADQTATQQVSSLAVARPAQASPQEVQRLLPEVYLSPNERLTFRYQKGWSIQEPSAHQLPISYTVTINNAALNATPAITPSLIHIYDPVHIIETIARENDDELDIAEVFSAYINKSGAAGTTLHPNALTEIHLGDKSALLWQPTTSQDDGIWLAFRALDGNVNLLHFVMPSASFREEQSTWLSFAETVDYQAPARRLDEIEKSLQKFIAATANGDYEAIQATICHSNRQTTDMVSGIFGLLFDVDLQKMSGALLSFSSGWTELDTSGLFFETVTEESGVAQVLVSGVVTLNGEKGRETLSFRRFNMSARSLYRLQQEADGWFICD